MDDPLWLSYSWFGKVDYLSVLAFVSSAMQLAFNLPVLPSFGEVAQPERNAAMARAMTVRTNPSFARCSSTISDSSRRAPAQTSSAVSHDGSLDAMDRRERVEQALPLLPSVPPDPELPGGGPEIQGWRLQVVEVQRVAQHREVALLPGQTHREFLPTAAAVFAAPDGRGAARTGARGRPEPHHIAPVG